jgi:hypothetical protein
MTRPAYEPVIATSARDDTLAYVFEDGNPAHNVLAIVKLNLHTPDHYQQEVSPRLYHFGSTFHTQRIQEIVFFFPDVLGIITFDTIALFHLPEDYGPTDRCSSPPVLTPYWSHYHEDEIDFYGLFLGPLHAPSPDKSLLALCINYDSYTLQVSRNSSECSLHFVSDVWCGMIPELLQEWELNLQGRGTVATRSWMRFSRDVDTLDILLYRTDHFKGLIESMDRLPPAQSSSWWREDQVRLSIPRPPSGTIRCIGYDEWAGTVAIQWSPKRTVGDEPECYMTVISLSGVTRAAAQGTHPVLQ